MRAHHLQLLDAEPRMTVDEGAHPAREGYRPPPRRAGSRLRRFPQEPRPMEDHRSRRHLQLLERIRRRLEVPAREMQIDGRVRQFGVTQQELNRAQIRAGFQQMCRLRVAQRVRCHAFVDAGLPRGEAHRLPDHLGRDRCIGTPAVVLPGKKYVFGRIQRQYSRSAASSVGLSGISRSRPPLPCSTRSTMRWLSMSRTFSWHASLRRKPAAVQRHQHCG